MPFFSRTGDLIGGAARRAETDVDSADGRGGADARALVERARLGLLGVGDERADGGVGEDLLAGVEDGVRRAAAGGRAAVVGLAIGLRWSVVGREGGRPGTPTWRACERYKVKLRTTT